MWSKSAIAGGTFRYDCLEFRRWIFKSHLSVAVLIFAPLVHRVIYICSGQPESEKCDKDEESGISATLTY